MIVWTTLLKGFQIAFVCVFEIRKLISFALILKLVPGARKASSVQTSKCSRETNCLARGLIGLTDFGFVQEMFSYLSMRWLLLDKENTCMTEMHPSGREKKPTKLSSPGSSNDFAIPSPQNGLPKTLGIILRNIFSSS